MAAAAAAAAAADVAAVAAPYHHRRHRLLRTAVVQLPVPMPGHLYNKRGVSGISQIPGSSGSNNNIINSHGGYGQSGILHGAKVQRPPFFQRLPSRIHDLTRAIEIAVSGATNSTQQQQRQHVQPKQQQQQQTSLKSNKPNNNRQTGSKKLQQNEKA